MFIIRLDSNLYHERHLISPAHFQNFNRTLYISITNKKWTENTQNYHFGILIGTCDYPVCPYTTVSMFWYMDIVLISVDFTNKTIQFIYILFQMSNETNQLLRDGRLITPPQDSLCGISLKVGKLYLISASNSRITLCDYIKEYSKMTIVERRGFAGGYKKGCPCDVFFLIIF